RLAKGPMMKTYCLRFNLGIPAMGTSEKEAGQGVQKALAQGVTKSVLNLHKTDGLDRKSTRLNSSHVSISYAVFCLKKKNSMSAIRTLRVTRLAEPFLQTSCARTRC